MSLGHGFARFVWSAAALAQVLAAHTETALVPPEVQQAADASITRAVLEAPIRFLSSDLLEGRGPGTRGDEVARLYLQTQLESMGYAPAFPNNAWQQLFALVDMKSAAPPTWRFDAKFSTWLIAQADAMPSWKPGDEFEAVRKRALAATAP